MNDTTHPTPDVSDDDHELLQMILEHTSPRVALLNPGEKTKLKVCSIRILKSVQPERRHIGSAWSALWLGRVPLENLGASPRTANHVVYRRI
jgi:hypothetical protein